MSMKKPNNPGSLAELRAAIVALKAEIREVSNAGLPADACEDRLRATIDGAAEAFEAMKRRAAGCLAAGELPTLQILMDYSTKPETPAQIALGAAMLAYGKTRFIDEVRDAAADLADDGLRMTAAERLERLRDLRRRLYQLELAEESMIEETGAPRRIDANPAAVLGLPIDVAEDEQLLGAEV